MARADLLQQLVKTGLDGDLQRFRNVVEAVASDERAKRHTVLADQLETALNKAKPVADRSSLLGPQASSIDDLLHEMIPKRTLDDLVLADSVRSACSEFVQEQSRAELLRSHGLEPRNRMMLTGPPGNGKTSLAEAIAGLLSVPLLTLRYDGVVGSFLGETAQRLRRVFEFVRTRPCVLFLDEFDTIGKERGDSHETGEIKRVVSSLLMQVDSLPSYVVLITATNHAELLDRAVWRRFQVRLELSPPTRRQVQTWFVEVQERFDFRFEHSERTLADKLYGASYSELEEFTMDVARWRVLSMPDPDTKQIVSERLKRWKTRIDTFKHRKDAVDG